MHSDARAYFSHVMHVDQLHVSKNIWWIKKYNVFEIKENANLYQGWDRATTIHRQGERGGEGGTASLLIITACGIWQGIILNIYFTQNRVHKSGSLGLHFIQKFESPKTWNKEITWKWCEHYGASLQLRMDYNWQYFMAWYSFQNLIAHTWTALLRLQQYPPLVDLGLLCDVLSNYLFRTYGAKCHGVCGSWSRFSDLGLSSVDNAHVFGLKFISKWLQV